MSNTDWTGLSPLGSGGAADSPNSRARTLLDGIAAVVTSVLLWNVSGLIGLVGGAALIGGWAVLPATYTFAVGQIALVAVVSQDRLLDIGLLQLALIEVGLFGVLMGPAVRSARGRRVAVWTLLGALGLGGVVLASYVLGDQVWAGAAALTSLGTIGAYGLYRYELIALGKVSGSDRNSGSETRETVLRADKGGPKGQGADSGDRLDPEVRGDEAR